MVITKPLKNNAFTKSKVDIDSIISKGANVIEDGKENYSKKEYVFINLRIPVEILNKLDEMLKQRVGISRTGLILEAIYEKLTKNEKV